MKGNKLTYCLVTIALVFCVKKTAYSADTNADGFNDDSSNYLDRDGDGLHDNPTSILRTSAATMTTPAISRDLLVVHESKPLAYFGLYRVTQMSIPGFELLKSTIDWLVSSKAPEVARLILFTYNGSIDTCNQQNEDGEALFHILQRAGYRDIEVHSQDKAASLPSSYYNKFDAAIYWNLYGHNVSNILKAGIPFVSSAPFHGLQMGITADVNSTQEYLDVVYVADNGHRISNIFPIGSLNLNGPMYMNALHATEVGRALVVAQPLPEAVTVEIDINPGHELNVIKPLKNKEMTVAILGSPKFNVKSLNPDSIEFGRNRATSRKHRHDMFRDVNHDGWLDFLAKFQTKETGIAISDTQACLNGKTLGGQPLRGCDNFVTIPSSKWLVIGEDSGRRQIEALLESENSVEQE